MASFLGIFILITVTSLWSYPLPKGIFTLSITLCVMTPSAPFSLSLMMKPPQYSGTTLTLTLSPINSCWNLGIVLYFMINWSLPLNRRINTGSFNMRTTFMTLINPPRLPFIWSSLFSLQLLQYPVPLLVPLSFSITQLLHMRLLLLFLPLWSQLWSPLVAVLAKTRVLSPPKCFRMKYMPLVVINIL